MSNCKVCGAGMLSEDLLIDTDVCLLCLNDTDGGGEDRYGVIHETKLPGGTLYLIKRKFGYEVTLKVYHYDTEDVSFLKSRFRKKEYAIDKYMNSIREYL